MTFINFVIIDLKLLNKIFVLINLMGIKKFAMLNYYIFYKIFIRFLKKLLNFISFHFIMNYNSKHLI